MSYLNGQLSLQITTPDLTLTKDIENIELVSTAIEFGSDRYVLEMTKNVGCARTKEFSLLDWDMFCRSRSQRQCIDTPQNLNDWSQLQDEIKKLQRKLLHKYHRYGR